MRFPLAVLLIIAIFIGCKKPVERIEDFIFDAKQISTKETHRYDLNSEGRIKNDYIVSYSYLAGIPIDSLTSKKTYEYSENGKVSQIFNSGDSTYQLKVYDEIDSLIADYTINNYGDTIRLTLDEYENGKLIRGKNRFLMMSLKTDFNNLKMEDFRNYDTMLHIFEFKYLGSLHIETLSFDAKGTVIEETQFEYKGGKKVRAIEYSILEKTKFLVKTINYIDNGDKYSDTFTLNPQGDTIGIDKTIYQDGKRIWLTANNMDGFKMQSMMYYDKMNRKMADVLLDLNDRTKTVYVYTYYDDGNLKEQTRYVEKFRK